LVFLICLVYYSAEVLGPLMIYAFTIFLSPEIFITSFNQGSILKSGLKLGELAMVSGLVWGVVLVYAVTFLKKSLR
jgi:hypothetical protein